MKQVKTATLDPGGDVPGFFDDPPHPFVVVEQNGEITPDRRRVLFGFHRQHGAGIQFVHLANHGLDVVGTEEDIPQHEEKARVHVAFELAHRRGYPQQFALLDVADIDAEIAAITEFMPLGGNGFIPDAFTDSGDGRGFTWGLCFFRKGETCYLARFDCDLSLDVHDPEMKRHQYPHDSEVYFKKGLSKKQRDRIKCQNEEVRK